MGDVGFDGDGDAGERARGGDGGAHIERAVDIDEGADDGVVGSNAPLPVGEGNSHHPPYHVAAGGGALGGGVLWESGRCATRCPWLDCSLDGLWCCWWA